MRLILFLLTNVAVVLMLSVVLIVLHVPPSITASTAVLVLIFGVGGSSISLLMAKRIAKQSTGAKVIDGSEGADERWLVDTVRNLSAKVRVRMPQVAYYEGEANAFATGAFRNSALIGVSTGLLQGMSKEEVEAVLAHELTHVANGDMVTLALIQGVLNTFVLFLMRIVGLTEKAGLGYYIIMILCQAVFSFLATIIVLSFSRKREFRADAGSAKLLGSAAPMVSALKRLADLKAGALPKSIATSGITNSWRFMTLFSTHPPIKKRIAALQIV